MGNYGGISNDQRNNESHLGKHWHRGTRGTQHNPVDFRCQNWCGKCGQKKLLERDADAEARDTVGWTALHWVSHEGNGSVCKILLENGANVLAPCNFQGKTPKAIAKEAWQPEVEQILFEFETKLKRKNSTKFCKII